MTDLEIMQRAKMYIEKMANGINPLTDENIAEDDILNNVKISRCLFYVSGVLNDVINNGGKVVSTGSKSNKRPFAITEKELSGFKYSQTPIALSEIAKRINDLVDTTSMKKVSYKNLADIMISDGYLQEVTVGDRTHKKPTLEGLDLGMCIDYRTRSDSQTYEVILYNLDAQHAVIELFYRALKVKL